MSALIPKITEISQRITRILAMNPGPMTLQGTNTYLLGKGKSRFLLDTGDGTKPEYIEALRTTLQEKKTNIAAIILSHWHYDHVGGIKEVLSLCNEDCKVFKFQDEKHDKTNGEWNYDYIENGHEFKLEDTTLKVIHTPGHTEDHIVVLLEEENAIFSGDCILGEGTAVFTDLWSYMKSLKQILDIKPSVIYPGHGPIIEDTCSRIEEYITHRNEREMQILSVLPKNETDAVSVDIIVDKVYKNLNPMLKMAAANNASLHLGKLVKDKKAAFINIDELKYWAI